MRRTRVLLDTDVGDDVDDAYTLALALTSPECELVGVVTNSGRVQRRARVARALLHCAGRADIPVFAGVDGRGKRGFNHRGGVLERGPAGPVPGPEAALGHVRALLRAGPLAWVSIGGLANPAYVLERLDPEERRRLSLWVMGGSLERDYLGRVATTIEDNLGRDPEAARAVFARAGALALVPLDATWDLALHGEARARIHQRGDALGEALERCYACWREAYAWIDPVLHDPLTLALVAEPALARWEDASLEVDTRGYTRRSPAGSRCRVAVAADRPRFLEWFAGRMGAAHPAGQAQAG